MTPNIVVSIIIALICILRPKSKIVCVAAFIFMWTLWGFNLWNGDYVVYMNIYDNSSWDSIEFGYKALCSLFASYVPYQGFLIIISGIILTAFCYWGIKHTKYSGLYALIYLPMFIIEYVFLRNYICNLIIFFSIFRIIFENGSTKVSCLLILLASTIHIFSICYLPIVFLLNSRIKTQQLIFLVIALSIVGLVASQTIIHSSNYLESKSLYYARSGGNIISLTTPFHIFVVLISDFICNHTRINNVTAKKTLRYFANFNTLSLLFIPVYFIMPYAASRSLRVLILINLFYYFNILYNGSPNTKKYARLGIAFLCTCIGYFFFTQSFEFVLYPLYYCNLLWGYNDTYQLIYY